MQTALTLKELAKALRAADPAAVLVSPRVLTRVLQHAHGLPSQLQVPHRKSYVVDRQTLFRHVEQEELDLEPGRLLPLTVILLARPSTAGRQFLERSATLLKYWRRLFHANIHVVLEKQLAEGVLTAETIRTRIEQIGAVEFDEIRSVLRQDGYLAPHADDSQVYVEFAAVYLELRYFAANLLPVYFPALGDLPRIDALLNHHLDTAALFARTRLAGAPDPVAYADNASDEPNVYYWKLMRRAERTGEAGNTVRAAILRTQAARVAPAHLTQGTRDQAQIDLRRLTTRLQAALQLTDAEAAEWQKDLPALLEKADQGIWTVEGRLLYDLQKVCVDQEKDIFALDLVEWALSGGKRPIKRPLPGQRVVRITKHLRQAAQRLTRARLADLDRQHLGRLLQTERERCEDRLRTNFRPVLIDAFHDVGLEPANPPERVAFHKMVEELLDRIAEYGFIHFSDLRDALSRNNLKLPDLAEPQEFVQGDPLLRLDRRLAALLDGVYRPGEFYLRWLERLTSLNFGTRVGRWLTRYITLPFGVPLVLVEVLQRILEKDRKLEDVPVFSPLSLLVTALSPPPEEPRQLLPVLGILGYLLLSFSVLSLMHVAALQRGCVRLGQLAWRGLRGLVLDVPRWLLRNPAVRAVLKSWPVQLLYWFVLKPLVVSTLVWLCIPATSADPFRMGVTFVALAFALNWRPVRSASEVVTGRLLQLFEWLRGDFLRGLYRLVVGLFKQVLDSVEYVLYTVDERLRFRSGDSQRAMAVRTVLGLMWFPLSYVIRFYIVVLIEPGINPVKAPVTYMAAKLLAPFVPTLVGLAKVPLALLGEVLASVIAFINVWWMLPGAFGFLFWEMKENWKLYRANRPKALKPVSIGPHGETLLQLLKPGFHSGTLPKLYANLRSAEREAIKTGDWRAARGYRHTLHELEQVLRLFIEREFVRLLGQSQSWPGHSLTVGQVALASNRVSLELCHTSHANTPVRLVFEEQAGWLVAGIREPGWLADLSTEQVQPLVSALAGLYKIAGVDLVREQVRAGLPADATYAVTEEGLALRLVATGEEMVYPMREPQVSTRAAGLPDGRRLIFAQVTLTWQRWVETWQKDQDGQGHPRLLDEDIVLLPD